MAYEKIYVAYFSDIFFENANCLAKLLGCEVIQKIENQEYPDTLFILFGANEKSAHLLALMTNNSLDFLIMQSEQVNSNWMNIRPYLELMRRSIVFDFSPFNARQLKKKFSIKVRNIFDWYFCVPDGDLIPINMRHFHFAFFGSKNELRETYRRYIRARYPHLNILWVYSEEGGQFKDFRNLTGALVNTKYVINIPFYHSALETHRICKALSCRCQVLSTYSKDDDLNDKFSKYVHFSNDLTKLIDNAVSNELKEKERYIQYFNDVYPKQKSQSNQSRAIGKLLGDN